MRELGLLEDEGGIETTFADVAAFAANCRFRDCTHTTEPGCAVLAASVAGELAADRLASYRKLVREIAAAERASNPVVAGRTKARWKATHRAMRARSKIDPKLKRD
jgi:ribosome biogenesis GTPase